MFRRIPLILTFALGFFMVGQFFVPHRLSQVAYQNLLVWYSILAAFALILGAFSLLRLHLTKISRRSGGWGHSMVTLLSLVIMALLGIFWGVEEDSPFMYVFYHLYVPLGSTMFSLLAFFVASASFRAFRVRTIEATVLLVSALVMMLGRVSVGYFLWPQLPSVTEWILSYPNMAAKRGILIGVGLGVISTALKVILGIERSYLSGRIK